MMTTKPKISVIVPVYNVEKWLDKCIDSILVQSYKNLDIILVNKSIVVYTVFSSYGSEKAPRLTPVLEPKFHILEL